VPIKTSSLDDLPALNLTAMIDVLFVLIIFFVVGTRFVEDERRINVDVPRVGSKGGLPAAADKHLVAIDRAGAITLDGNSTTLPELTARLASAREHNKRLSVLLRGDAGAPFQLVASVLNACKEAGVADLGVSVKTASARRASDSHGSSGPR